MEPYTIPVNDQQKAGILEGMARQRTHEIELVSKYFDKEQLFRFSYVPFVVAALVWDYADTIIDIAKQQRIKDARVVTRRITELKAQYDALRAPYVDREHQASETDNMEVAEEMLAKIMRLYNTCIAADLKAAYPSMNGNRLYFLIAVYQCLITLRALLRFVERQRIKAARRIGCHVGNILPPQLAALGRIITLLIDKPVTMAFSEKENIYVDTIATQIGLIGLNDVSNDTVVRDRQSEEI